LFLNFVILEFRVVEKVVKRAQGSQKPICEVLIESGPLDYGKFRTIFLWKIDIVVLVIEGRDLLHYKSLIHEIPRCRRNWPRSQSRVTSREFKGGARDPSRIFWVSGIGVRGTNIRDWDIMKPEIHL